MASSRTILQLSVPRELMGRVMSFNTIAVVGFGPLGGFLLGPLAEGIGAPGAIFITALVVIVVVALLTTLRPTLRRAD
jgi:MFS family permease